MKKQDSKRRLLEGAMAEWLWSHSGVKGGHVSFYAMDPRSSRNATAGNMTARAREEGA